MERLNADQRCTIRVALLARVREMWDTAASMYEAGFMGPGDMFARDCQKSMQVYEIMLEVMYE